MEKRYAFKLICLTPLVAVGLGLVLPGRIDAKLSEKQEVEQALASFRDRLNVKDIRALVGQLPDEPVRKGPGGAYPVVTTAEAEYSVAERKEIRDELKGLKFEAFRLDTSGGNDTSYVHDNYRVFPSTYYY
ncbi:MAG: hypothetical protein J7J76_08410 [Candidatus Latescibacteria bacterium]|nr:hypothetical protein [Candidatus Latescibacterota bacterium]